MRILEWIARYPLISARVRPFCIGLLLLSGHALAQSGHTVWNGWSFDWEVKDNAGIAIRNVYFNNELFFYKASMPVIRVKYGFDANGNTCGPYADQLNWNNLLPISNCGNNKVCQKSYSKDGRNWLELGVLAAIGKYRIYQVWMLSQDGYVGAQMWSRGLHCNLDHDHHPYWRVDADIGSASPNQVFEFDRNLPDAGWGPGWLKFQNELNEWRHPPTDRKWFLRNANTAHGSWVLPGMDGVHDAFSSIDAAPRLYRYSEDGPWHSHADAWLELRYAEGETIAERDVVFWYIAHLHHDAAGGADHWHGVGPWFKVQR